MEVLKLKIFIKQLSKTAGPFVFHCSFCLFKLSLGAKAVPIAGGEMKTASAFCWH